MSWGRYIISLRPHCSVHGSCALQQHPSPSTMAPVRRYLRVSKYTVLECRIYLDNPALVQSWLLNPRNPVLPRVIESVRPWVLPKLREEQDRARKKSSSKKKGIKDTVVEGNSTGDKAVKAAEADPLADDFEVSIFLTETGTRHSILTKHKHFHDKAPQKIRSNTGKLMGETNESPIDVDSHQDAPQLREESDDDNISLANIPAAPGSGDQGAKRRRDGRDEFDGGDADETPSAIELDSDTEQPPPKRLRDAGYPDSEGADGPEDKKKLAMDVSYEGFAIYGRVLCLVVRKKETRGQKAAGRSAHSSAAVQPVGQAKMETWISSTQMPVGEEES